MKSIFKSKTFWFNVLGGAISIAQIVPPKYSMPIMVVSNIGLRMITNQPVSILPTDTTNTPTQ